MELDAAEFSRGQQQAAADIAADCPKLYWQTRGSWGELLTRLMAERFHVAVQHTSDIATQAERSFHAGYNQATTAYIDQRFGDGSFQSVLDEIAQYRDSQYRRYLESL